MLTKIELMAALVASLLCGGTIHVSAANYVVRDLGVVIGYSSEAMGINDLGDTAGHCVYDGHGDTPVYWRADGSPTLLTDLATTDNGMGYGINNAGQ